jgi:hypothetical protein
LSSTLTSGTSSGTFPIQDKQVILLSVSLRPFQVGSKKICIVAELPASQKEKKNDQRFLYFFLCSSQIAFEAGVRDERDIAMPSDFQHGFHER